MYKAYFLECYCYDRKNKAFLMSKIGNLPNKYQKLVRNLSRGKAVKPQKIINMYRHISEDFYENSTIDRSGFRWKKPTRKINGKSPEGNLNVMEDVSAGMVDWKGRDRITGEKFHIVANLGYRKAGTRVGIHVHEDSGITFVLKGKGAITDYVESLPNSFNKKGDYYFMPSNVPMSAANLTKRDVLLLDLFVVEPGTPLITIIEPGYPGYQNPLA